MIYITGDTHGELERFSESGFPEESKLTSADIVIVCGDFGFVFSANEKEKQKLDALEKKPYTICFVDGNHENFNALSSLNTEMWNGGKVHRVRKNIIHLMRGQVFSIEGKTFMTMGGAYSIDRNVRKKDVSYWDEETPNDEEYKEALKNIGMHQNKVDYVLTHTAPRSVIWQIDEYPDPHDLRLTSFLETLKNELIYKHWYCGHWHLDVDVEDTFTILWFDVKKIV